MPGGFLPVQGVIQRAFSAGELAPAVAARADQAAYTLGLRTCRNFVVRRSGGVTNRPGTRFVVECKTASPTVQLMPFFGDGTPDLPGLIIECGVSYLRFIVQGALVTLSAVPAWAGATPYVIGDIVSSAGVNYYCILANTGNAPPNATFWHAMPDDVLELPHGFGSDLPYWSQDGHTLTLTHQKHRPQELINLGGVDLWVIRNIITVPQVDPPTGLTLTTSGGPTHYAAYVVTTVSADFEESIASGQVIDAAAHEATITDPHVLSWTAAPGAEEYRVYSDPYNNGVYGFVGTSDGSVTTFHDPGIVPDFTVTPPLPVDKFATADQYPAVSGSYQQRRLFGNTKADPQVVTASRVGFPSNFTISSPLQDDDAITFRLKGWQSQPVRHLLGLKQLVIFTERGEWNVSGDQSGALTPSAINADQQGYMGSAVFRPAAIGHAVVYAQNVGSILREIRVDDTVEGLAGKDLTLWASHLTERRLLTKLDYAQTPHSVIWAVRNDGILLGLTYLPELSLWGWHRHDTLGFFHDVAVMGPEDNRDVVYVIVRRTIDGSTVRYIELFESREYLPGDFDTDAIFMDCSLSYQGAPTTTVGGLDHLESERVAVVADGAVVSDGVSGPAYVVTGGVLTPALTTAASTIHVGLPYQSDLETLDMDVGGGSLRDAQKAVGPVQFLLERSARTFSVGPDATHLTRYTAPDWEGPADEFTGQIEISTVKTFNRYGRVFLRQTDPLPLTILGVVPDVEVGG